MSVQVIGRSKQVESLRGILSCWVVLYHIVTITGINVNSTVMRIIEGGHAVNVFMIISGFVICLLRLENPEPYVAFLTRRYLRLFPVFAVAVTASVALAYLKIMPMRFLPAHLPLLVLAHVTLLHGVVPGWLVPGATSAFLNPTWSLTLEWQFYLIAPAMIALMTRSLSGLMLMTLLVCIISRIGGPIETYIGLGGPAFILGQLKLFWVGIISGILWARVHDSNARTVALLSSSTAALLFIFMPFQTNEGLIIWSVFFAIIITVRAKYPDPRVTRVSVFLEYGPLLWLGSISYSIYVVHEPLIWIVRSIFIEKSHNASERSVFIVCIATVPPVTLAISSLLYRFVEKPGIALGRRLSGAMVGSRTVRAGLT